MCKVLVSLSVQTFPHERRRKKVMKLWNRLMLLKRFIIEPGFD
ncbi:transposase [Candidatus Enterovibrio escicola]|nr:transposase [Candidatus Enterovibrio escacola]